MFPSERYQQDLHENAISLDFDQRRALVVFDRLYRELEQLNADSKSAINLLRTLFQKSGNSPLSIKGIYLWGGVGRGKTYLMDSFFNCILFKNKMRTHFHRFMQSVHKELKTLQGHKNPLEEVADRIAQRTKILCFDEFFVLDIGDAMILAGLFEALFQRNVVLVATSNIHPDALYMNGLQRERFVPAIELIKNNVEIVELGGEIDYRLRRLTKATLYHYPINEHAERELRKSFHELVPNRFDIISNNSISILERQITIRYLAEDIVWFDFDAICGGPRSVYDYIEIAKLFHALIVSGVPRFSENMDDKARRFVNLVDELYDRKVKLIVSAEVEINRLYQGKLLDFEFKRTESRLLEMQSHEYLSSEHLV